MTNVQCPIRKLGIGHWRIGALDARLLERDVVRGAACNGYVLCDRCVSVTLRNVVRERLRLRWQPGDARLPVRIRPYLEVHPFHAERTVADAHMHTGVVDGLVVSARHREIR